ncbi:sentrin-specific protease 7 [Tachysurus vachellii]|uniref:sentrin-specific protease 7 n=1 Tax=Tachysurus vachellii TaxID=175792 RepID=UPI00296B5298|nr:sentrin-specific protease 7 [Tachysurus vachellii]XP_060731978.1 sentrin-specific protease 7 [Tachysurus vachellii]
MPHEKGHLSPITDGGVVPVDHRKALTITQRGKLDNCQIGNPLKIHERKVAMDEYADADMAKRCKKLHKIHWTQLAANGASSESDHRHNGRQTDEQYQNVSAKLDIKSRQLKVILMDVLQTEEGQRYLSSCKSCKIHSSLKKGSRERWSEKRHSAEHSTTRRRANVPCKDQTKFSPFKLTSCTSSNLNDSAHAEENVMHLSKEVQSPPAKKCKRFNSSLKQTKHSASDEEGSCSLKERVSAPCKESQNMLLEHKKSSDTTEDELSPVEESYSPRPTFVSLITATHTSSKDKQPSGFLRTDYQDSESEAVPSQQSTSKNEAQECAEEEVEIEQESEEEAEPLHQNGEVVDEGGGARRSVLCLSTGASECQLPDGKVTPKSSETAGCADEQLLDSEFVEVRRASKPQTIEPIVLSSEEEEDEEVGGTLQSQAPEGDKDPHRQQNPVQAMERKKIPDAHMQPCDLNSQDSSFEASALSGCPMMELQFSALYMGSLSAVTNGLVKITDDKITISFKDPSGSEVKASLATAHVRKYSVWDGHLVRDSRLAKENEVPPSSVLVLWLAEVQARHLSGELFVFQPGTHPCEGSTCVALCVCEPLNGVQGALLASIMDIVGLKLGNAELLSPLTHPDSLKVLQNSPDSHILQLLLPRAVTHAVSCESGTAPAPASTTTTSTKVQDSDGQPNSSVYTLCQSRGPGAYSVSLVHKPGTDWTPYRHCGPARRLIQFPPPPSKGALTVTTEDLECLDSGEFLNDVIIDFYLKYLLVQKAPRASVRRSHIFSSFFYKQLTRRDNANEDSTSTPAQLRRHQRVRTWTRHVDIFEKDFLFVPVNQEAHWYLVVVCFPGLDEPQYVERGGHVSDHDGTENSSDSTVQSESQHGDGDTNSDENSSRSVSAPGPPTCTENTCQRQTVCKRPCILIMDSLKLSVHERIFKLLREYLQAEWEVKRGGHRDFSAEWMVGSHCRVPLQDNSSDCGLYLLQYAESFLQDPVVHFDLPLKLESWFPRQKVRKKREEIRDLVLHLYRFQQGSLGNYSSDDGKETGI